MIEYGICYSEVKQPASCRKWLISYSTFRIKLFSSKSFLETHCQNECLVTKSGNEMSLHGMLEISSFSATCEPRGGELPNVGYTGMCHRPGSIFHLQKSRTGSKVLKFYSRIGPIFWSFTPEQDPFLTIWSPMPWLKCQKSQLLSSFVSCSLMSSFLFCKVFQAFYNWDQLESGHMYSSLNLTWFHHCG